MVSDILDVYELIFNSKYHENNSWKGKGKLEIKEWKSNENLKYIKEKMPILFNSLNNYYKTDIAEDKLYFVVYTENGKDKLLACTSPMTGFVTPPDMDKSQKVENGTSRLVFAGSQYEDLCIRRKSGGSYFRDTKMFEDRESDFKNYMYNELFGSDEVDGKFKTIKEYIRLFRNDKDIRNDYSLKLKNVKTDQNDELVVNGLAFKYSDEEDIISYFTPTIIRIPYRIDSKNFKTVKYHNDIPERNYDYLLPFKPEILRLFEDGEIDSYLKIKNSSSVTVHLKYKGRDYEKRYSDAKVTSEEGTIVDLGNAKINFDLGLFPNILSPKAEENNYFKILVVACEEYPEAPNFNIDRISLSFFKGAGENFMKINEVDPNTPGVTYGVMPSVVRSTQKTKDFTRGTKFYELFKSSFDAMQVTVLGNTGLIIPLWKHSMITNDTYSYAVDLGTSNTFMARCKNEANGAPDLTKRPELFTMAQPVVNYLHETPNNAQIALSYRIEDSIFDKAKQQIKTEFVPALIDGVGYRFPIRTAICGKNSTGNDAKLFDDHNIAFFYEKLMANDDQNIRTNIKWDDNGDLLRVFIKELLLIIKCDILQRNGDLSRTHLVWFRPLSFMGKMQTLYNNIWKEEAANILFVSDSQISCYSESEAPYYYFKNNDDIKNSAAVSVIDIGGGSTDFVYFKDNKPKIANSVHFGCDVIWDNGFNAYGNVRENGIYQRYAPILHFNSQKLEDLNECFKDERMTTTKDIINFWLSNSDSCDILKWLENDYKPLFVYHLTAILFYMSCMYKDNNLEAPKTIVFSGNGSKYIDDFISSEPLVLQKIIDMVLACVYTGNHCVNVELPKERKESTCYGGLYRDKKAETVPETVYQGDKTHNYETVGDTNDNYNALKKALLNKYDVLNNLYENILSMLKKENVIDNEADTSSYVKKAMEDMGTPFDTYFKTQVKEKYQDDVRLYDSVFFLPIIDRIFNMTKI